MNEKTPWNDVSRIWKKIAATIAAVGIIATFTNKVFNMPADMAYIGFSAIGLVFLMISWYVDKQAIYTHEELEEHKKEARGLIEDVNNHMSNLTAIAEDTRRDTLRIQLLMLLQQDAENVDTILKVAETYFVKLHGDWYMTNEFSKWAKKHDVQIPTNIYDKIIDHLEN